MASTQLIKEEWNALDDSQKEAVVKEVHELKRKLAVMPATDAMDENFKRLSYVRYADDFLCGVVGSKTEAIRIKEDISNIRRKYGVKNFAIYYTDKKGKECKAYFYNEGFKVQRKVEVSNNVDLLPDNVQNLNRSSLITRLKSNTCEFCGKTDCEVEIHHVRKLKDLKGKAGWERLMIARNRKTICFCVECHDNCTLVDYRRNHESRTY